MGSEQGGAQAGSDYEPDFVMPRHNAIHEDNCPEYEARGFVPVPEDLDGAQQFYGTANIYTGHAFDYEAGRPSRHEPGVGVYTTPAGLDYVAEKRRWWKAFHREVFGDDEPAG